MNDKNPVVESMYRYTLDNFNVRLWINRYDMLHFHDDKSLYDHTARHVIEATKRTDVIEAFVNSHPEIAAIEVLDISGNGVVYYPDWH